MTTAKMLGASGPHVYVTRAATLDYLVICNFQMDGGTDFVGTHFEAARRELTERLMYAIPESFSGAAGKRLEERKVLYLVPPHERRAERLRAAIRLDGRLLVVIGVSLLRKSAPLAYTPDPGD